MRIIKFLVLVMFLSGLLLMPFSAKACNVRPYAKAYINKIHNVFGGTKPGLVIENGDKKNVAAFYNKGVIHIYKGDYAGKCKDVTPYLKSVISHEYAHHVAKKLNQVSKLKGEKLAYVAEHSIGDTLFQNVEYDNKADLKYPEDYDAIAMLVVIKQYGKSSKIEAGDYGMYFKK